VKHHGLGYVRLKSATPHPHLAESRGGLGARKVDIRPHKRVKVTHVKDKRDAVGEWNCERHKQMNTHTLGAYSRCLRTQKACCQPQLRTASSP
jgi:hypothetical protein